MGSIYTGNLVFEAFENQTKSWLQEVVTNRSISVPTFLLGWLPISSEPSIVSIVHLLSACYPLLRMKFKWVKYANMGIRIYSLSFVSQQNVVTLGRQKWSLVYRNDLGLQSGLHCWRARVKKFKKPLRSFWKPFTEACLPFTVQLIRYKHHVKWKFLALSICTCYNQTSSFRNGR